MKNDCPKRNDYYEISHLHKNIKKKCKFLRILTIKNIPMPTVGQEDLRGSLCALLLCISFLSPGRVTLLTPMILIPLFLFAVLSPMHASLFLNTII